jgi:ribosomal protein S27AE
MVVSLDYCVVVDHLSAPNYRSLVDGKSFLLPFTPAERAYNEALAREGKRQDKLMSLEVPDKRSIRYEVLTESFFAAATRRECGVCGEDFDVEHPVFRKRQLCPNCGESPLLITTEA